MPSLSEGSLSDRGAATLCYALWAITGVVFLVLEPYSRNPHVRFHAFQSIFFSAAFVAGAVLLSIFTLIVSFVMPVGLAAWILPVYRYASLALWLYIMWSVYQGKDLRLPVIGRLAQNQV